MRSAEELARLMPTAGGQQLAQTAFRRELVLGWNLPEGARVLEIGCGQGDTTLVLADAVGPTGRVLAVDVASPSYGAPLTIGESTRALAKGPLGTRMEFRFEFDVLKPEVDFDDDAFDAVVLAHCTWYFQSVDQLRRVLHRVRPWAHRLYLSEWDLEPQTIDQLGHLLAVWIQAQVEANKTSSRANVRTPYSSDALKRLLTAAGWVVTSDAVVNTRGLADGEWEIRACFADSLAEAERLGLDAKTQSLLASQIDVLRRLVDRAGAQSLPAYAITAERT